MHRPGTIEFPGIGVGARCSDNAANSVAIEVWQSLRCMAERVLRLSQQSAHDPAVIDLDDVASVGLDACVVVCSAANGAATRDATNISPLR
jgi:hypothetical protein